MRKKRPTVPAPPSDLSAASKQLWREIHEQWQIDAPGRVQLLIGLRADEREAEARALVAKEGMVLVIGKATKAHPALKVLHDAATTKMRAWRALGLDAMPTGPMGRPPGRGPA